MPKNFHKVIANTPKDVELFVSRSMDILDRLHELLEKKFEGKQKLLAEKMGKSEAEVSKILAGVQNFTLKTLTKLEAAFGEPIIGIQTDSENFDVAAVKCPPKPGKAKLLATKEGDLLEKYENIIALEPKNLSQTDLA